MKYLKFPYVLFVLYLVLFILLAIAPFDRTVWLVENIPVVLIVLILVITYKKFQFSNVAYFLMFIFIVLHTIGGHYTFARVPFDWITDVFGFERNNFDRLAHFCIGLYAYPFMEILIKLKRVKSKVVLLTYGVLVIMTIAGGYEIFEWRYAIIENSQAGIEVLGSQGDIRDAQKDIFADALGAIFSTIVFYIVKKKEIKKI
ncbi:MAG: hypothetical protein CR971_00905 [candidate division SR1 bacterium]|nr:MAG: hypothetical protein CR971_00905 [candidate division SR1 bacterium]